MADIIEKIHLYLRESETGRIITHFLYPKKQWEEFETIAALHGKTVEEEFREVIREYSKKALVEIYDLWPRKSHNFIGIPCLDCDEYIFLHREGDGHLRCEICGVDENYDHHKHIGDTCYECGIGDLDSSG